MLPKIFSWQQEQILKFIHKFYFCIFEGNFIREE